MITTHQEGKNEGILGQTTYLHDYKREYYEQHECLTRNLKTESGSRSFDIVGVTWAELGVKGSIEREGVKNLEIFSLVLKSFTILLIVMELASLIVLCDTSNRAKKNSTPTKKWSKQSKQQYLIKKQPNPAIQINEIPIDTQQDLSDLLPLNLSNIIIADKSKDSTENSNQNDDTNKSYNINSASSNVTKHKKNRQFTPTQLMFEGDHVEDMDDDFEVEEFYSENPVDQKQPSSFEFDVENEIKLKNKDFEDFDDTEKSYKQNKNSNNKAQSTGLINLRAQPATEGKLTNSTSYKKKTKKREKKIVDKKESNKEAAGSIRKTTTRDATSVLYKPAEAINVLLVGMESECAMVLRSGGCLTFAMIERALRRARQALSFRRPQNLNSDELDEGTIHQVGELVELTTRILAEQAGMGWEEVAYGLEGVDVRQTSLWSTCPQLFRWPPACRILTRYRTHTGQCNNPLAGYLGSANMPMARLLPADYSDGVGAPRRSSASGGELPPVRLLALNLHPDIENPSPRHSVLFMSWGQLLNHDISRFSAGRAGTGQEAPCCQRNRERTCMPFEIGADDPVYSRYGIRCHEFKRSLAGLRPGCSLGPRNQFNTVTSFVDGSFVYGSSRSMSGILRAEEGGFLRVWDYFEDSGLLPLMPPQEENPDEECIGRPNGLFCFLSGDLRTNQQIQLAALHTVHTRQHNRIAGALGRLNPHWTSNKIYHEARHIHVALIQHVVLNEYLPALLGPTLCAKFNLTEAPLYWDHYNPTLNPAVSQAFSAAAFRQGHSTVPNQVFRFNNQHEPVRIYQLRQLYRQPWALFEPGAMDEFLLGMLTPSAQTLDPFIGTDLSGHLLKTPNEPVGLDLTAINIQRGRDQGVAGYNAYRELCGLGRARNFQDLDAYMSNRSAQLMAMFYETVDDIDLFTGGISEFPLDGAQVGPTFACIIGNQFQILRSADRMWFETSMAPQAFTVAQLASIKQVSLARIICANSDNIVTIQQMALLLPHPILNPRLLCDSLPDLDITLWFDPSRPTTTLN